MTFRIQKKRQAAILSLCATWFRKEKEGFCPVGCSKGLGHAANGDAAPRTARRGLQSCKELPCKILICYTWILPGLLSPVPFLNFTMIQSNRAHAFLGCYTEADSTYSRSCTDKDMGNFGGGLWLVA